MAETKKVPGVRIASRKASFRRCGTRFTSEGADFALDAFDKKDLKVLRDDPNLTVADVDVEVPAEQK